VQVGGLKLEGWRPQVLGGEEQQQGRNLFGFCHEYLSSPGNPKGGGNSKHVLHRLSLTCWLGLVSRPRLNGK
jgi:hypothetical protein